MTESKSVALPLGYSPLSIYIVWLSFSITNKPRFRFALNKMVEGDRFELPNPKERIYSPPRLATSLPLRHYKNIWWRMTGSNRRPPACKAGALPAELIRSQKFGDPYGIRTRVTAVKGRCLNRLTKGPIIYKNCSGSFQPGSNR